MIDLGIVKPGRTLRIPFSTFDKDDGSSITMTNYAVADILIYKDGSTTERASTSGFTATTDFDSKTGKHLLIIDLADNTTADFFQAGSEYIVGIDAVTVDTVTVGGWVARFTIGYRGSILDTTIATLSSQTSFTLTTGPAEDDALNGMWAIIHDAASAVQWAWVLISDYTGSTKTVTLAAGATFTAAAKDNISIMGPMPLQPTTAGRTLDVSAGGEAGIDWANVGSPTTTLALTGTTIASTQKVDVETIKTQTVTCSAGVTVLASVGTAATSTAQTGDSYAIVNSGTHGNAALKTLIDALTAIFTGITSLAQWLGLIAGKQVGNTTARTELRATGAGSGTYDETTDSQEALRDRGDAAWITATGFSTFNSASDKVFLGDGAHGGTSATLRLGGSTSTPALYVTNSGGDATKFEATGGNGIGFAMVGFGTGEGMRTTGGSAGDGTHFAGGTAGHGLHLSTSDGHAIYAAASGTGNHGILASGGTSGDGMRLTAGTGGKALTAATIVGDITGSLSGSVGSVTGNVGGNVVGSVGSISGVTFPSNFAALGINVSGHVSRVTLVDTTTTNTDMRGTDSAALAATALSTTQWTNARAGYLDELAAANLPADIDQIKADLPARVTRGIALSNFPFLMVDATDGYTGETGLTVTATRSIDGAAFAACANSASEIGSGMYKINLASTDLDGVTIVLKFSASGARDRIITILTQPT